MTNNDAGKEFYINLLVFTFSEKKIVQNLPDHRVGSPPLTRSDPVRKNAWAEPVSDTPGRIMIRLIQWS